MVRKIDGFTKKGIHLREKFSISMVIKLAITFVLSLILFYATNNEFLEAFFGFVMIISGAIILLFLIIYLIFYFIERIDSGAPIKKIVKKKVVKKRVVKKKVVKKRVKKKVVKRKAKK